MLRTQIDRGNALAISAISLLEIAVNFGVGNRRYAEDGAQMIREIEEDPNLQLLPLSRDIAIEVALLGDALRDPMDRAIVATARVHRMTLLTSDDRIIKSKLVATID